MSTRSRGEPTDKGNVKGITIRGLLDWSRDALGEAATHRIREQLHVALPSIVHAYNPSLPHLGLAASAWYPAEVLHTLCDLASDGLSPSQRRATALSAGRALMATELRGIYKALFRLMASPERYAQHAQRLWRTHFDNGDFAVEATGAKEHRTKITGWRSHHVMVCESLEGSEPVIYETMGCRNVKRTPLACVADGAPACEWVIRWT